jgi:membrane dipeptidase
MENGSPIEHDLANLEHFHDRGIRYITLTHSRDNHIADSSYSTERTHRGLSPFGREVVAEMNRLGIMIDIAHVSDAAFMQVLELSAVPVIASHSSCRHFTPGFERNVDDEMLRELAAKGGVIQINFGSSFISDEYRRALDEGELALERIYEEHQLPEDSPERRTRAEAYWAAHPLPEVRAARVADHIDHVVRLVGIEHVGFGSDFDGVGEHLPVDLRDASMYPNLIRILLERGYSEAEIEQIAAGNVLRVWQAVEDYAKSQR